MLRMVPILPASSASAPLRSTSATLSGNFRRFVTVRFFAPLPANETRPYLFDSARRPLAERARRDTRYHAAAQVEYEDHDHIADCPHDRLEMRDELRRVESAISKLKPKARDIFLMHRFEGLDRKRCDALPCDFPGSVGVTPP